MSFHFYLSSAPADNSEDLQNFFKDLTCAIQARLQQTGNEEKVGFFEPTGSANGHGWRPDVAEALRTSQTMVALISPHYFQSEQAGKEWQVFESRRRISQGRAAVGTAGGPSAIVPVVWISCKDLASKIGGPAQQMWEASDGICGQQGLLSLRRSLYKSTDEYVKTLVALAERIIGLGRNVRLPSLDVLPTFDEVASAFRSNDHSQGERKKKAVIVEDDEQVREMLHQSLDFYGFECQSYADAKIALRNILMNPPDVLLIDLELEHNKMQGIKLIEQLTAAEEPTPPIIAMSAGLSNSELIEALKNGADDVVAKPFDIFQILERVKNLASIGQKRERFRKNKKEDRERNDRPVFLSYSFKDQRTASILRTQIEARGIDVWYASDMLLPGDADAKYISEGLERAQVFVPLVTENYRRSAWCAFEMAWFRRSQTDKPRVVVPVLEGVMDRLKKHGLISPIAKESEFVDITFDKFADGLTTLLLRVQRALDKNGHK
jgi:DNA-binding response OmpR family regulator